MVDAARLAKDGFAVTAHRYEKPGDYLVRVQRTNARGELAIAHLHGCRRAGGALKPRGALGH